MPTEEKGIALQVILSKCYLVNPKFQVALEKNFFHNQPSALRRSVDFLAERLASNVIRKVRTMILAGAINWTNRTYDPLAIENSFPGADRIGVKGEAGGHSGSSTTAGKQSYKYRQTACSSKCSAWPGPKQCGESEKLRRFVQRLGREQ